MIDLCDFPNLHHCSFPQKVYKASYEKARGSSINYCDTPKFQMDSVLKKLTDVSIIDLTQLSTNTIFSDKPVDVLQNHVCFPLDPLQRQVRPGG